MHKTFAEGIHYLVLGKDIVKLPCLELIIILYVNVFPSRKAKVEEIVNRLSPESKKDEVSVCTFSKMKFGLGVGGKPAVQVCFTGKA